VPSGPDPGPTAQTSAPLWPEFAEAVTARNEPAWKRRLIRAVAAAALLNSLVYVIWRPLATLSHANLWVGVLLYGTELLGLVNFLLYTHDLWQLDDSICWHPPERDYKVAVIIPTYNEPREVLLPTVTAAVTIQYPHETWVLDDGKRTWVAEMAEMLGAVYRTRPEHTHAKAGNMNAVLPVLKQHGIELVAIFDADHVPKSTFLDRLLGHFDDPKVALVQTPQDFYNLNSFEHARLRRGGHFEEQNFFFRILEAARNSNNSAFWCGTSAVVRLDALLSIGGVATDTVTEDQHTTIKLHKAGWKTVYHNEVLARGLAAANWEQFFTQRMRWAQGGMQILRKENLITDKRLTRSQRLSYFGGIFGWFQGWYQLVFLSVPLITVLTGALPMSAPLAVFFPMWIGNQLLLQASQRLLSRGSTPMWHAIVFTVLKIPAICPATFTLLRSRPLGFKVTPKGKVGDTRRRARVPLILRVLLLVSVAALAWYVMNLTGHGLLHYRHIDGVSWAAGWATFDLATILAAVHRIKSDDFSSDRRASFRFDIGGTVAIDGAQVPLKDLSLAGARVLMPEETTHKGQVVTLEVPVVDFPIPLQFRSVVRSVRPASSNDQDATHVALDLLGRASRKGAIASHSANTLPERPRADEVGMEFIDPDTVETALLALNLFRTGASVLVPHGKRPKRALDLSREFEVVNALRKRAGSLS